MPNLNVFRTDVAQFFQLSIDCIVKAVLEQKNSAHKTISVSLVTCYSLNIGFQTIFFISACRARGRVFRERLVILPSI